MAVHSKQIIINNWIANDNLMLEILNLAKLNLNLNQIIDKNINLKLTKNNINIKKLHIINIGVNQCSQE